MIKRRGNCLLSRWSSKWAFIKAWVWHVVTFCSLSESFSFLILCIFPGDLGRASIRRWVMETGYHGQVRMTLLLLHLIFLQWNTWSHAVQSSYAHWQSLQTTGAVTLSYQTGVEAVVVCVRWAGRWRWLFVFLLLCNSSHDSTMKNAVAQRYHFKHCFPFSGSEWRYALMTHRGVGGFQSNLLIGLCRAASRLIDWYCIRAPLRVDMGVLRWRSNMLDPNTSSLSVHVRRALSSFPLFSWFSQQMKGNCVGVWQGASRQVQ